MRNLIARVLAEHHLTASAGTWRCRCGEGSVGEAPWQVTPVARAEIGSDADRHLAEQIVAAIEASQPDHIIEITEDRWTIQHSMACRVDGRLFDCPVNRAAYRLAIANWPDDMGRYRCDVDERGWLVIGEAVTPCG
jgi:hypothetical protein